jgi:hypothetical protein
MRRKSAPEILSLLQGVKHGGKYKQLILKDVIDIIKGHITSVEQFAADNPKFLDRKLELTARHLESLDRLLKEQWALYEELTNENPKSKNQALNNIKSIIMEQAKLQMLLGSDREIHKELEKSREANRKLVIMFKTVTRDCPVCKKRLDQEIMKHVTLLPA